MQINVSLGQTISNSYKEKVGDCLTFEHCHNVRLKVATDNHNLKMFCPIITVDWKENCFCGSICWFPSVSSHDEDSGFPCSVYGCEVRK